VRNPINIDKLQARPYQLKNTIQHYEWGKRNDQALIANLLGLKPEHDKPYAELWIGTHPKGPSQLIDPDEGIIELVEWISENQEVRLGYLETAQTPPGLPYLFKVLSAAESLSIQAHPNKQQAKQLHEDDPYHYPDDNHKPEIAIAIDSLDALVGFISQTDYTALLDTLPPLNELLNNSRTATPNLKQDVMILLRLWDAKPEAIKICLALIHKQFSSKEHSSEQETLFLAQSDIHGQDDIGLLFLLLLNRVHLGPGEAIFLPPGVPHAYLHGNIIECMANSDNVVRLGLTKKFCDAKALSNILNFGDTIDYSVNTQQSDGIKKYLTPTQEFSVQSLNLEDEESKIFTENTSLVLFLVLEGEVSVNWCTEEESCSYIFRRGASFIVPANLTTFNMQSRSKTNLYFVNIPK
jgi:mannose-6-phosphate isomerase